MPGRVVILNGPSSVGKSTIADGLQASLGEPWLAVAFDDFLRFMPSRLVNVAPSADPDCDGSLQRRRATNRRASWSASTATGSSVACTGQWPALAQSGLDVIVDDVLLEAAWLSDYLDAMVDIDVVFVGVKAPLQVIEEREIARGDRFPRQARGHFGHVHHDEVYDITVDTSVLSPEACVDLIASRIRTGQGTAFDRLRDRRLKQKTVI